MIRDEGRPRPGDETPLGHASEPGPVAETLTCDDVTTGPVQAAPAGELAPGTVIDRYVIRHRLGAGGMGVVYAAHDPELDRMVALKLIRADVGVSSHRHQTRLRREAQAMARLSHPNVVAVHDVGSFDGEMFIAMELVDGDTLDRWLAAHPLGDGDRWRALRRLFLDIGEGLAAAHAAGIVHRDFKPGNVLVDAAGRPRITDFGLAHPVPTPGDGPGDAPRSPRSPRSDADAATSAPPAAGDGAPRPAPDRDATAGGPGARPLATPLTHTGAMLGTPRYMAPEQHLGQRADERSDLFAFCVTLHAALCGEHPFAGDTPAEIAESVVAGRLRPIPPGAGVPPAVRQALLRGLQRDPDRRFASMAELLDALAAAPGATDRDVGDPGAGRRRRLAAGGALALAIGAAAAALIASVVRQQPAVGPRDPCGDPRAQLARFWDDPAKARLRARFRASGRSHVDVAFATTASLLDGYAADWTALHQATCDAASGQGWVSERVLDLRMACLDDRKRELKELVAALVADDAPAEIVDRAVDAASGLAPVSDCADIDGASELLALPADPGVRRQIAELREQLAAVRARRNLGHYPDALARVAELADRAAALGYPPLTAEALWLQGQLEMQNEDAAAAERVLVAAARESAAAKNDPLTADIWIHLVYVVGTRLARYDDARALLPVAEAALARAGEPAQARAEFWLNRASLAFEQGQFADALDDAARAQSLLEHHADAGADLVAAAAVARGNALVKLGRFDEAQQAYERAVEIDRDRLGLGHPTTSHRRFLLGMVRFARGDVAGAAALLRDVVAAYRTALGPDHLKVATAEVGLADALARAGQIEEAVRLLEHALAVKEAKLGPDDLDVADVLVSLAARLDDLGRRERARQVHERTIAIYRAKLGTDHPKLAVAVHNYGSVLEQLGDCRAAVAQFDEAYRIFAARLGDDHPNLAYPLVARAQCLLKMGEHVAAIDAAERGVAIASAGQDPQILGIGRFELGRALYESRRDRARGRALAASAHAELAASGAAPPGVVAEMKDWLARHR